MFLIRLVLSILSLVMVACAPYTDRSPVTSIKDEILGQEGIFATSDMHSASSQDFSVSLSKLKTLKDELGNAVAQCGRVLSYKYTATAHSDPGILFKLMPVARSETSVFGYIIPSLNNANINEVVSTDEVVSLPTSTTTSKGLMHHYRDLDQDDSEWVGEDDDFSDTVLGLLMEVAADGTRIVRIETKVADRQFEEVQFRLPAVKDKDSSRQQLDAEFADSVPVPHNHPHYSDKVNSLEDYIHYYRGIKMSSYTKLRSVRDTLQALFVGFLSPFLLLGAVFVFIAAAIYMCVRSSDAGVQLPDDMEQSEVPSEVAKKLSEDPEKHLLQLAELA